ncbi:hypothetical protein TGRH88_066050 [Toxoplasma gondii]|uniref:Uncharacterized protein n=1 Tax=Toxoplasma gondii TaxID=5811 RepID=A0A7J6JXG8_TOXGO|nr:hypothetical protein TGRH88_066050 [Toxoplasma gondii]
MSWGLDSASTEENCYLICRSALLARCVPRAATTVMGSAIVWRAVTCVRREFLGTAQNVIYTVLCISMPVPLQWLKELPPLKR